MLQIVPCACVEELHEANRRLQCWLERLFVDHAGHPTLVRVVLPEEISDLLRELVRASEIVRLRPQTFHMALEREMADYRERLERLQTLLPSMQNALLEERARLEQERERVRAAAEWTQRSRQTL